MWLPVLVSDLHEKPWGYHWQFILRVTTLGLCDTYKSITNLLWSVIEKMGVFFFRFVCKEERGDRRCLNNNLNAPVVIINFACNFDIYHTTWPTIYNSVYLKKLQCFYFTCASIIELLKWPKSVFPVRDRHSFSPSEWNSLLQKKTPKSNTSNDCKNKLKNMEYLQALFMLYKKMTTLLQITT